MHNTTRVVEVRACLPLSLVVRAFDVPPTRLCVQAAVGKQTLPRWPIFVFLVSAALCLLLSSVYHTFYIVNPEVSKQLAKLDYVGISLLIGAPPLSTCCRRR